MKPAQVARFRASQILRVLPDAVPIDDFTDKWKDAVPDGVEVDVSLLKVSVCFNTSNPLPSVP